MNMKLNAQSPLPEETETLIHNVIGCCIAVHRELGPGFSEKVYVRAICLELAANGLPFEQEKRYDVRYRDEVVGSVRLDVIVGGVLVLEIKAIEELASVHHKQILNCMRVAGLRAGLLLNFNVGILPDGLSRKAL